VTDYGEENPLLMDYYNFDPEVYKLKFNSRGDGTLSRRVVELFHQVHIASILRLKEYSPTPVA
jgi:aromatic ring-opening dioxygenase catalytic subunit (LigB family)